MKTINVEVSSKDTVLGTINVEEFESVSEAVQYFESKEAGKGEEKALGLINSQHRANVTNGERVRLTRGVSPMKALRDKIKSDPAAKAALEALLLQFNLPAKLDS